MCGTCGLFAFGAVCRIALVARHRRTGSRRRTCRASPVFHRNGRAWIAGTRFQIEPRFTFFAQFRRNTFRTSRLANYRIRRRRAYIASCVINAPYRVISFAANAFGFVQVISLFGCATFALRHAQRTLRFGKRIRGMKRRTHHYK